MPELSHDCKTSAENNHILWEVFPFPPSNNLSGGLVSTLLNPTLPDYVHSNFALADNGARVIPALTSPTAGLTPLSFFDKLVILARGYDKAQMHVNPPRVVLEDYSTAADCWRFEGLHGHIAMSLSETILWHGFTLHFPDQHAITEDALRQTPKELAMWALVSSDAKESKVTSHFADWKSFVVVGKLVDPLTFNSSVTFQLVAKVVHDASGGSQSFTTQLPVWTSVILVEVLDNWGNDFTCLHRISVHGKHVI